MNSLSFCSRSSTALINSQGPYEECQICHPTIKSSKIVSNNIEEDSKFSNHSFRFNELAEVIKYFIGSYLDFLDLTRIASTQRSYQHILKYQNNRYSPYIIQKLRCANVLTPEILYLYKQASGKLDIPSFFKECHVLTHIVIYFKQFKLGLSGVETTINDELRESILYEPNDYTFMQNKKLYCTNKNILIKNLNSNIKHLTIISDFFTFEELTIIVKTCPNLEELRLSVNTYISNANKLKEILDQFKNLKLIALTPINRFGRLHTDNLSNKHISELIARGVHIKLLENRFEGFN